MNSEMKNRKSPGEMVLIMALGVFSALFIFLWLRNQTPQETPKIMTIEHHAYVEESQSLAAIQKASSAVVAIIPMNLVDKFQHATLLFQPAALCANANFVQQPQVYCDHVGGNGVILTSDGLILTSQKVFADLDTKKIYRIFVGDGTSYDGKIVAVDAKIDLVLMKAVQKGDFAVAENQQKKIYNLPVLDFGNAGLLKTGQRILSLGFTPVHGDVYVESAELSNVNLLGLNQAQSFSLDQITPFSANQNFSRRTSGGPVVNLDGQLIGMNTFENDVSAFAPISVVQNLLIKYRNKKSLDLPQWGMEVVFLTSDIAKKNNSASTFGLVVSAGLDDQEKLLADTLKPGQLAEKFALHSMDIILAVNDKLLLNPEDVGVGFFSLAPGDTVKLRVNRDGKEILLNNTL
jgi:S1-C subfamily serine protease